MDDRELLELAARAAGIELLDFYGERYSARIIATNKLIGWNPLTDDGDAFRLAVKLELIVGHDAEDRLAYAQIRYPHRSFNEFYGGTRLDARAAMRRAIVAAAAAIAQEMTDAKG